jgi:hypothetical protein
MKKSIKSYIPGVWVAMLGLLMGSCEGFLEENPKDRVDISNYYTDEQDAIERSDKGQPLLEGDGQVETLLFEVVAEGDRSARADYLTIHWEAGGRAGDFDFPLSITLCTTVDQDESRFCDNSDS